MGHRWKRLSWQWKSAGVAMALALLAVVPIQMATGQTADPVPFDAGQIRLHMAPGDSSFTYEPLSGSGATQSFTANTTKCVYQGGTQSLMAVSAPVPPNAARSIVGYQQKDNGYGLGVNTGAKEGSGSCAQTNLSEQLVLELQNDAASSPVHGLYIDHADLDVEFKFNATLHVALYKDNQLVGNPSYNCTGSDCGPDAGGGDNFRVHVTDPDGDVFDKMAFTVTSSNSQAAAVIEGGNDAGTSDSIFHLVELLAPVECGATISGSGGGTDVDITLVDTADCSPKGYALNVTTREIELITGGGATGQWVVDVDDWAPEPAQNPVPASTVFPPEPDGEPVVWCDGAFDADDVPSAGGTYGASMPGGHSWCLIRQNTAIAGGGEMQVNELLLLEADARIGRG